MKLDRNLPENDLRGKYALLLLRKLEDYRPDEPFATNAVLDAVALLDGSGLIDWGITGSDSEFFVMRLKDRSSRPGLLGYAADAQNYDGEWADEVRELASRAGRLHPACKTPD